MIKTPIKNILVVDDHAENIHTINTIFVKTKLPYKITSSPNGKIALKLIEKKKPDLIISDWEMPEMDGIEFVKQLKKNTATAHIPVIMCTGAMTSSENLETALSAGAVDYIRKPIDALELIARTKANLHLAESYSEIKKLNDAKDNILAVISHDLIGPVGSISSFSDLIIENIATYEKKQIKEFISLISNQSNSIIKTLENLLSWAKNQKNSIVFQKKKQMLIHVINDSINLLKDVASKKNITITHNVSNEIVGCFDFTLISTVIRNLISNAIKFTYENGRISIEAIQTKTNIQVSVIDNGVGMSKNTINTIFDKTIHKTTYGTNAEKGSGIGLEICNDFIKKHDGKIWVESVIGKGSSFTFTIPA